MIWKIAFATFKSRVGFVKNNARGGEKFHPIKYFLSEEAYELYWTDVDQQVLSAEIKRGSFRDGIEEQNFKNEFLNGGLELLEKPVGTVVSLNVTKEVSGSEEVVKKVEEDLLGSEDDLAELDKGFLEPE